MYGGSEMMNPRMMTGRIVADMLERNTEEKDPMLEHLRTFLPHYQYQEYEIVVPFRGLTLVMHLDGLNTDPIHLAEYKTGVQKSWDQERVDKHEQLSWYALGIHLKFGVRPEDIPITLSYMPTVWPMNVPMPRPTGEIENFQTKRGLLECVQIGKKIVTAWNQIEKFYESEREAIGL
jgi:hypothetical protein